MSNKTFGNKYIRLTVGKTIFNEQTVTVGVGRCRNNYIDYFFVGINLMFVYFNLKIKLPNIAQRDN